MLVPTPRVPVPAAQVRPDIDDRLTPELVAVLFGARRRAHRDGDRQIDTAHLLHSLLEYDAEARDVLGGAGKLERVLGYLVQRSIGYGLGWQRTVEDSGPLPVLARPGPAGRWSPSATGAMERALLSAARRGALPVRGTDLLAALVADRGCRAVDVLVRTGVDVGALEVRPAP
jgi:hypothetical protein